jgi:hypothetical protein
MLSITDTGKCNEKVNAMTELRKIAIGLLGMTHLGTALRALKFAFAALIAGSRAIPLGDNGCITRELGAYGARLKTH